MTRGELFKEKRYGAMGWGGGVPKRSTHPPLKWAVPECVLGMLIVPSNVTHPDPPAFRIQYL